MSGATDAGLMVGRSMGRICGARGYWNGSMPVGGRAMYPAPLDGVDDVGAGEAYA